MSGRRWAAVCAALALASVQAALLAATAWDKSDTADETRYLAAAGVLWAHSDVRYLCEAPVLPKWGFALALRVADPAIAHTPDGWEEAMRYVVSSKSAPQLRRTLFAARAATIVIVVTAGLLLWSAGRRGGEDAALLTHALWCLSPTVLANGALATLDAWAAALMAAIVWAGVRLVARPSTSRTVALGIASGAAAATKATTLGALPIVAVVTAVVFLGRAASPPAVARAVSAAGARDRRRRWLGCALQLATLTVAFLVTVWGLYGFTRGGVDFADPCPVGTTMAASPVGQWPFPAWIEGLAFQLRHGRAGHLGYLFGEVRSTGWWWFYLACLALKLTIAAQLLVLVRSAALLWSPPARGAAHGAAPGPAVGADECGRLRDRRWQGALLAYPLALFLAMSAARHQANISFLLPAFPPMMLWVGCGVADVRHVFGRAGRALVWALLLFGAVETLRVHPHYLMFFNAWAGGPEGGPRYLVHREDWGQDERRLGEWQRRHGVPRLFYTAYGPNPTNWGIVFDPVPCVPTPGVYALHAVEVHRPQFIPPGCLDWLTVEPPDERIGFSIYVYQVDAARIARLAAERDTRAPFWRSGPAP